MMPSKRVYENGSFNAHRPDKVKHSKTDFTKDDGKYSLSIKVGLLGGKDYADGERMTKDNENALEKLAEEDYDDGERMTDENENALEKLAEVIAEAKNYLKEFDFRYSNLVGKDLEHISTDFDAESRNVGTVTNEVCVAEDISHGKEKIPIRAMNGVNDDRPPSLTYVTRMVYPSWYQKTEPDGCDCVDGCSDSRQCPCVVKNRGEIPYNENGSIMKTTARVHECGPLCNCLPTCMNRVSQLGPRYRLEIFKTKNRGWGVRSRDVIPSGGFVCEYIGEFLREKEADLRVGSDEYLFDICKGSGGSGNGYSIDAAVYGNIGRFFNHSCSPNMYAQKVIYDHVDHRMPHIMFFATEEIPPLKELSYDYNYKLGTVCDADGNIKTKDCYCGSHKCKKRLY